MLRHGTGKEKKSGRLRGNHGRSNPCSPSETRDLISPQPTEKPFERDRSSPHKTYYPFSKRKNRLSGSSRARSDSRKVSFLSRFSKKLIRSTGTQARWTSSGRHDRRTSWTQLTSRVFGKVRERKVAARSRREKQNAGRIGGRRGRRRKTHHVRVIYSSLKCTVREEAL